MKWLLVFCCFGISGYAEEVVVHLAAQSAFTPVYLAPIREAESSFEPGYARALEKVLRFDFDQDGYSHCVPQRKGAALVEVEIHETTLSFKCTTVQEGQNIIKGKKGISLSGKLNQDRRVIHQIHDALFETLYGTSGVASSRILYTVRTRKSASATQWVTEVWSADYDGANAKQVTHDSSLCVTPSFVPNPKGRATQCLYVSYKMGQPKIYLADLATGEEKRLSYLRGDQLMPALSPKSDRLAFISDITGNPDLFIQDFSPTKGLLGKPRQIFSAPGAAQGTPSFSPDGKRLVYVSNKDGTPRIYLLNIPPPEARLNDLSPKLISKKTRENTCPAWSPDGTKIAYSALIGGVRQIWIYDIVQGETVQLTEGKGHKENPSWASDSLHLLFDSTSGEQADVYLTTLTQKKATKITQGAGERRFPAWEPLR